jgi:signal transduction histidine kinase
VEAVVVDDRRLPGATRVVVPSSTSRLQVDYSTLQLSRTSTTRFRYRLMGFDPAWIEAGTQRQAVYTNLAPGAYQFLVQAESEEHGWGTAPTRLALTVQPAFHQTLAFYALLLLTAAGLGWLAWQARLRMVRRQFALALAERVRLSREMHDTLLQGLVGFALQLDNAAHTLDGGHDSARMRLVRMRRQVEGYIRDVRQSIWDLRSDSYNGGDLTAALRETCTRLSHVDTRVELRVRGTARACEERVERNLLRIGQEAITNAVHHAMAKTVIVELAFGADALSLRVVDDGVGFDAATQSPRAGHYGIVSMRERAADIGGVCEIRSTPDRGTVVDVRAPWPDPARVPRGIRDGSYADGVT